MLIVLTRIDLLIERIFAYWDGINANSLNGFTLKLFGGLDWNHLSLVLFIAVAAILCVILSGLSQMLSRSIAQDAEKRSTYECGFSPHDSATRAPFDVHYYVVGIMFLVFDVEIALIFPFASCAEELDWLAYTNMAIFVVVLTVGYGYE
jgi:NADH-quinone oxidoreductase subunit A